MEASTTAEVEKVSARMPEGRGKPERRCGVEPKRRGAARMRARAVAGGKAAGRTREGMIEAGARGDAPGRTIRRKRSPKSGEESGERSWGNPGQGGNESAEDSSGGEKEKKKARPLAELSGGVMFSGRRGLLRRHCQVRRFGVWCPSPAHLRPHPFTSSAMEQHENCF